MNGYAKFKKQPRKAAKVNEEWQELPFSSTFSLPGCEADNITVKDYADFVLGRLDVYAVSRYLIKTALTDYTSQSAHTLVLGGELKHVRQRINEHRV